MTLNQIHLPYYRKLLFNSIPLLNEVFPQSINSYKQLSKYLSLSNISPNIKVPGRIPLTSFNKSILNPGWSMLGRGGKQWRPLVGLITSNMFVNDLQNVNKHSNLYKLLFITDIIHNASLILDDIEDKSEMRRGKKCVHLQFGEDISINAGISMLIFPINYLLSTISKYPNNIHLKGKIAEHYFNELTSIHLGQGWDIQMKCTDLPTVQTYIDTVLCKTGVCPRLIVKMVKVYVEEFLNIKTGVLFNDILDLIDDLSVAFQIWDDLMNLRPSTVSKNKNKIGEDITEGKLTIMVLHSLHKNNKYRKRLMNILMKNTKDQNEINEAIDIMHKNGSIAYSERVKDLYLEKFEKKCKDIMFNGYNKYERKDFNYKVLNALIELKTSLIKV